VFVYDRMWCGSYVDLMCCNVPIGCQMLRLLVSSGIKCAYVLINSLSFVMREVIDLMLHNRFLT